MVEGTENNDLEQVSNDLIEFSGLFRTLLKNLTHEWNKRMTHNLSYTQFKVMFKLYTTGGSLKVSELAEFIGITSGAITGVVDKLLSDEYVSRERASDDRRVVYIEITPKGKAMMEEVMVTQGETVSRYFNVLPEEDIQHLRRIFSLLNDNLDKK